MTDAALTADGSTFLVDAATGGGAATGQTSTALSDGRVVVTWQQSTGQLGDTSGSAVVAKILNADGSVAVPDFLVNTTTTGNQLAPAIAALAGGGFVITWSDASTAQALAQSSGTDVRAQVFSSAGTKVGSEIVASSTASGSQSAAAVTGLGGGGFAIGFNVYPTGYEDTFTASGARAGAETRLTAGSSAVGSSAIPVLTPAASGGFQVLTLQSDSIENYTVYGQGFAATGAATGGPTVIDNAYYRREPPSSFAAVALANGTTLFASDDPVYFINSQGNGEYSYNIAVLVEATDGTVTSLASIPLSSPTLGSETASSPHSLSLAALANGDAAITWFDVDGLHVGTIGPDGVYQTGTLSGTPPVDPLDAHVTVVSPTRVLETYTDANGAIHGQLFDVSYFTPPPPPVAPSITGTVSGQTTTDAQTIQPFQHVSIADLNSGVGTITVTVQLDNSTKGQLTNLSGGRYSAAQGLYTFTGSLSAANAALDALTFVPTPDRVAPGGSETTAFTVSVDDGVGPVANDAATTIVTTTADDAPPIAGGLAGQTDTDTQAIHPLANVTIRGAYFPGDTVVATVRLSAAANGTLSNLSGGTYDPQTGLYSISGSVAGATAALDALVFTPTAHQAAAGSTETTTFSIGVTGGTMPTDFDNTSSVVVTETAPPAPGPIIAITGIGAALVAQGSTSVPIVGTVSEASQITSVLVYNGTTLLGGATVSSNGSWVLNAMLANGTYADINAVAIDNASRGAMAAAPFTLVTGIAGTPYATQLESRSTTGQLTGRTYYDADGNVYLGGTVQTLSSGTIDYLYASGSSLVGQAYNSYQSFFTGTQDNAQYLQSLYYYSGVTGASSTSYILRTRIDTTYESVGAGGSVSFGLFSDYDYYGLINEPYTSYEVDYQENQELGSKFYYTDNPGADYALEEVDVNPGGLVTGVVLSGLSETPYSSITEDFVGGAYAGAVYHFTSVPPGATYSAYELVFDQNGTYAGARYHYANPFPNDAAEEVDTNADGSLQRAVLTGITGQPYTSLDEDFDHGTYTGYKEFQTGITGTTYTGLETDVSAAKQIEAVVYSGIANSFYNSVEVDYANGVATRDIYTALLTHQDIASLQTIEDAASGQALVQTYSYVDGHHTVFGMQPNQTLTALGTDTFTGGAAGQTFSFGTAFGHDSITDLSSNIATDHLSFSKADFTSASQVLAATTPMGSNALITVSAQSAVTLLNVSVAQLSANPGLFTFHS